MIFRGKHGERWRQYIIRQTDFVQDAKILILILLYQGIGSRNSPVKNVPMLKRSVSVAEFDSGHAGTHTHKSDQFISDVKCAILCNMFNIQGGLA